VKAGAQSEVKTAGSEKAEQSAFNKLVRSLRVNVGRRRSTARLHLRPPELGRIRIDARMDGRRLAVVVRTETSAARELLRSRVADLHGALEQHGVKIDRFEFAPLAPPEQQDSNGTLAFAGDPGARRSAFRDERERAGECKKSNRITAGEELVQSEEAGETEPIWSAAAETRLDVRV
jgi:hypothetical protein